MGYISWATTCLANLFLDIHISWLTQISYNIMNLTLIESFCNFRPP